MIFPNEFSIPYDVTGEDFEKMLEWFPWPESIKKRGCRYILQHYLGDFLQERIRLEQLSVDLFNGTGSVSNINLDLSSLNEQLASVGVPIEVLDGFVRNIKVEIPWSNMMKDSCTLTLKGLELTVQMAEEVMTMQGMCESLFQTACTMTTSIEIAEKVVQDSEEATEGLDSLAQYIENILARVKICLYDTVLRVERGKEENLTRIEIRIKRIEYSDEQNDGKEESIDEDEKASIYMKKVSLSGATFWHDKKKPGSSRFETKSPTPESPPGSPGSAGSYMSCDSSDPMESLSDPFALVGEIMGTQEVRFRIQPRTGVTAPKLWLDANFQPICFFVCPSQVHSVLDLINELTVPTASKSQQNTRPIHFEEFGKIEEQVFEDVDDEDDDDKPFQFQPGGSQEPQFYSMYGSGTTSVAPSMTSSQMTLSGSSTGSGRHRRQNNFMQTQVDPNYGGYQYSFKFSSLSLTILHNDPVSDLREMASEHFEKMREFQHFGLVNRSMGEIAAEIHLMSQSDRLTIFVFPLSGSVQQTGMSGYQREALQLHAQMGQLWIWEHLFKDSVLAPAKREEGLQIPILKFRQDMAKSLLEALPEHGYCVKVNLSQTRARSSIRLELGKADFEFDPSIIDRISRIIGYAPPKSSRRREPESHDSLIADLSRPDQKKQNMEVNLSAEDLSLKLRIPIPDRRDELHRAPWFQRRVRDEIIKVDLHSLTVSLSKPNSVNISIKEVQLFFLDDELDLSTPPCVEISANEDGRTIVFPSISIETKTVASKIAQSMYSSFHQYAQASPQTPFSSQRTSYGDQTYRQTVECPADPAELDKFRRNLHDSSLTMVKLNFPRVRIELLSNKFYEKLFNRLAWDLAMWKPVTGTQRPVEAPKQVFFDLDEDDELPPVHKVSGHNILSQTQTTPLALELDIEDGDVILHCRPTNNSPGPEIQIDISDFKLIFAVKYLSGVADYLYISAQTLSIKHRVDQCAEFINWLFPKQSGRHSFYRESLENHSDLDPMLTLSLKLENEEDSRSLAHYTVAVGIANTTVRFRMVQPGQAPWDHLGIIFNVEEELPVGYEPPAYITSLHLNLKDMFIDYRPLYLASCAVLSIDCFTLSTVLRPNSKKVLLSMIGEYVALHISTRLPAESHKAIDLKNDCYAKLLVAKLLEVSIRIDPDAVVKSDIVLRGDLSLETCADSFSTLNRLIQYITDQGDFNPDFESSSENTSNSTSSVIQPGSRRTSESSRSSSTVTPTHMGLSDVSATSSMIRSTPLVKAELQNDLLDALEDDDFLVDTRQPKTMEDSIELSDDDFDDFIDLEAEPGIGFLKNKSKPTIRHFQEYKVKENFFRVPLERKDILSPPREMAPPECLLRINELNITWQMFAGSDFPIALENMRMDRTMREMRFPKAFSAREKKTMVELSIKKFKLRHDVFNDKLYLQRLAATVEEIEIIDHVVTSQFNKLLSRDRNLYDPNLNPAIIIKFLLLNPEQQNESVSQDAKVRISIQPIKVNLDQDTAVHLYKFFNELSQFSIQDEVIPRDSPPSSDDCPEMQYQEKQEIFFKEVNFAPDLSIRIDYQGKRVETSEYGTVLGLLIGLGQLNCSQVCLKRYSNRNGVLGVDRLVTNILTDWGNDIKRNQIPKILGGVGPLHSIRQLLSGFVELFNAPVEAYKRDGRVLRGVRRGASAFSNSTAVAALELSSKFFDWIDFTASVTHDFVSSNNTAAARDQRRKPTDLREGISNAYGVVHDGLKQQYFEVGRSIGDGWQQRGLPGAVGSAFSSVPATLVRPVVLAAKASKNALDGARNTIKPKAMQDDLDKYKY